MYREPIAMGRKLTQINGVDQKEERNIQSEKNEETRLQKNEERLRNLQDIFKCSKFELEGYQKEKRRARNGKLT